MKLNENIYPFIDVLYYKRNSGIVISNDDIFESMTLRQYLKMNAADKIDELFFNKYIQTRKLESGSLDLLYIILEAGGFYRLKTKLKSGRETMVSSYVRKYCNAKRSILFGVLFDNYGNPINNKDIEFVDYKNSMLDYGPVFLCLNNNKNDGKNIRIYAQKRL